MAEAASRAFYAAIAFYDSLSSLSPSLTGHHNASLEDPYESPFFSGVSAVDLVFTE